MGKDEGRKTGALDVGFRVRVSAQQADALKEIADQTERTVPGLIRLAIREFLEKDALGRRE
jgi:predicted transcriptional regulator